MHPTPQVVVHSAAEEVVLYPAMRHYMGAASQGVAHRCDALAALWL